jgi:hypothetical protein
MQKVGRAACCLAWSASMKGEITMDVISELDTLCIVAREVYGDRGVVLASADPWWCVAGPAEESIELPRLEECLPLSALSLEAAKMAPELYSAE